MKIGIISLISDIHNTEIIKRVSEPIIKKLKDHFDIEEIKVSDIDKVDIPIVFVQTGGTENKFKQLFSILEKCNKPLTLLSSKSNNSLPAALEILSWINGKGLKNSLLLHGSMELIIEKLKYRLKDIEIIERLKRSNIGVLGKPSDWLIASDIDYNKVEKRYGVSFIDIKMDEIEHNIKSVNHSDVIKKEGLFSNAKFHNNVTKQDILEAGKIYLGIKKTISDYKLSALTLRCFDLVQSLKSTGCLALAQINDEGIPAGCEGDIPALFTMLINHLITGQSSFMANPSFIKDNEITFAHCTVPMSIVESYGFKTHFETDLGVGIAGKFKKGGMTLSKIGGFGLDKFYIDESVFIQNLESDELCRTQIIVRPDNGIEYFLSSPLGNHHIISNGNYKKRFIDVMSLFETMPIN